MRRTVVMIALGVLLVVGAVAGFVILPEHRTLPPHGHWWDASYFPGRPGLQHTLYDVLRILTWSFLVTGTVIVAVGLLDYGRRPAR
jgi:hypothetical protein